MNMHYQKGLSKTTAEEDRCRAWHACSPDRSYTTWQITIVKVALRMKSGRATEEIEDDCQRVPAVPSFLWFRKNLNTGEYGHEEWFGTRGYLPKLDREIPLRRGSYAVNGMGSMSGNLNCEGINAEKRERSMGFLGKAVPSLAFKFNNYNNHGERTDRNGTLKSQDTLSSRAPDANSAL